MLILKRLIVWLFETCLEATLLGLALIGLFGYDQHGFGKSLGLYVGGILLLSFYDRLLADHSNRPRSLEGSELVVIFGYSCCIVLDSLTDLFRRLRRLDTIREGLDRNGRCIHCVQLHSCRNHCPQQMGTGTQELTDISAGGR